MPAASASTYKLLRELWPQKAINEVVLETCPTLGIIKKDTSFYEKTRYIAVGHSAPQGLAPTFTDAKASKSASKAIEFAVTPVSYYGAFSIEGRLLRQAQSNKAVIVDVLKRESNNLIKQWKRDMSRYLFGNGGGALAQMTAGSTPAASATITLSNAADIRGIEQTSTLQTSTTDGTSGSVKTGSVTVASFVADETTSTVTVDQATWAAGIPTAAASDYIFRLGAFGAVVKGFDAWCPNHSGTPGTLFGVNRNVSARRLAGIPVDARTLSPRQAVLRSARIVYDNGGKPDTYIVSTLDYENLQFELQAAGLLKYSQVPSAPIGKFNFGVKYDAIMVMGPAGPINVIADPDCPAGVARMLTLSTWTLASTGELVHWIEGGGAANDLMMEDAADAFEGRLVGDYQLYCDAPGWNARVRLS